MYSTDLKQRVIRHVLSDDFSLRDLAKLQEVSKSTIHRWIHACPLTARNYQARKTTAAVVEAVRADLQEDPFMTYAAIIAMVKRQHETSLSRGSVRRCMTKAGFTRKRTHRITQVPDLCAARTKYASQIINVSQAAVIAGQDFVLH